jgi:hypothetical protein
MTEFQPHSTARVLTRGNEAKKMVNLLYGV